MPFLGHPVRLYTGNFAPEDLCFLSSSLATVQLHYFNSKLPLVLCIKSNVHAVDYFYMLTVL